MVDYQAIMATWTEEKRIRHRDRLAYWNNMFRLCREEDPWDPSQWKDPEE